MIKQDVVIWSVRIFIDLYIKILQCLQTNRYATFSNFVPVLCFAIQDVLVSCGIYTATSLSEAYYNEYESNHSGYEADSIQDITILH